MGYGWRSLGLLGSLILGLGLGNVSGQCTMRSVCQKLEETPIIVIGTPKLFNATTGVPPFAAFKVLKSIKGLLQVGSLYNFGFVNRDIFILRPGVATTYVLSLTLEEGNYLLGNKCDFNKPYYSLTQAEKAAVLGYPNTCKAEKLPCPDDVAVADCETDPCSDTMCPQVPNAVCIPDTCGACTARFYYKGQEITSDCLKCSNGLTLTTCRTNPCNGAFCDATPEAVCVPNYCSGCSAIFHVNRVISQC